MYIFTSYLAALKPLKFFVVSVLFAFTAAVPFSEACAHNSIPGATVKPGDIAFTSFNFNSDFAYNMENNPNGTWSFVALEELPAGTVLFFTNTGWNANTGSFLNRVADTDPVISLTLSSGLAAGTVVVWQETIGLNGGLDAITAGSFKVAGDDIGATAFPLATSQGDKGMILRKENSAIAADRGDQILCYVTPDNTWGNSTKTFIAAINVTRTDPYDDPGDRAAVDAVTGWHANPQNDYDYSSVPPDLTNGINCLSVELPGAVETYSGYRYNGVTTGDAETLRAAINDRTNWESSEATSLPANLAPVVESFDVTTSTAPTPTTITFDAESFADGQEIPDNHNFSAIGKTFNIYAGTFDGGISGEGGMFYIPSNGSSLPWYDYDTEFGDGGFIFLDHTTDVNRRWYDPEALIIKTTDGSDFKFTSFKSHDASFDSWGNYLKITGYKDGVPLGSESVVIVSDVPPYHSTVTLTDPIFGSVDEVRIMLDKDNHPDYPYNGDTDWDGLYQSFDTFVIDYAVISNTAPTVTTTTPATAITATSATLGGNVTADGGATVTERGIVWATTAEPTIEDNKVIISSGTGSFSQTVSGLPSGTVIYYRAYATNSVGTAYGDPTQNFTTLAVSNTPPTAFGVDFSGELEVGATLTGAYNFDDADDDEDGSTFQWYRSDDINGTNKAIIDGATAKTYTLQGADAGKYISFEVTPYDGTDAGESMESDRKGPVLVVTEFSGELETTHTFHRPKRNGEDSGSFDYTGQLFPEDFDGMLGQENNYFIRTITPSVTGDFSIEVVEADLPNPGNPEYSDDTFVFLYSSFDPNAPLDGLILANDDVTSDNLLSKIDLVTLTAGDTYYIVMTSFSDGITGSVTFQVKGPSTVIVSGIGNTPPTVTTTPATAITATSATLGGNVTADGGATVTERGIVWATTANPTTEDNKVIISSGTGSFSQTVSDLPSGTTIYYKAYATNSEGTSYGDEVSFTTSAAPVTGGVFWYDDFEDASNPSSGTRTPSNNGGGTGAYFKRTDGSDMELTMPATTPDLYSSFQGDWFWAGEDHDAAFGSGNEEQQIEWTEIDISGKTDIIFRGLFAARSINGPWDNENYARPASSHTDFLLVEYSVDDGLYLPLLAFYGNNKSDKQLALDTDGDQIGDGAVLTKAFAEFEKAIPETGSSMQIRIRVYSNNTYNEEWAIDNFRLLIEGPPANTPPTASEVSVSGTLEVGEMLTGSYTYADADDDAQDGTTFRWYRSDDADGTNKVVIAGATAETYTLQAADADKYISFEVTPHDGTNAGDAVESERHGPVLGAGVATYCAPVYSTPGTDHMITQIAISENAYSYELNDYAQTDHTPEVISVIAGRQYTFNIETIGWIGVGIAVDFNNDGDFADENEIVAPSTYIPNVNPETTYEYTITLPADVEEGDYRLRLWADGGNATSDGDDPIGLPCGTDYQYGTYADFTLRVNAEQTLPTSPLPLNGVSQHALVPHNDAFDFAQGTIEMWFKPDWDPGTGPNPCLVAMRSMTGETRFSLHLLRTMDGVSIWNSKSYVPLTYAFEKGTWYHIAFVMGTSSTKIYINGESIGQTTNGINTAITGLPLEIGGAQRLAAVDEVLEFFNGEIDEVRIWNTQRSESEIQNNLHTAVGENSSGLVAYYPFDADILSEPNDVDRVLLDHGPNGLHGTLYNYWRPVLTTAEATEVNSTVAVLGGEVTSDEAPAIERGVVYNTTGEPTTADTTVQMGNGSGEFSQSVTGLLPSTTYYVRAYVVDAHGPVYGQEVSFTTPEIAITPTDGILYVDREVAEGNGSGDSWENAIPELADALKWAREQWGEDGSNASWGPDNPLQIWVAKGTYNPLYHAADDGYTENGFRNNAFVLVPYVQLYGGFSGNENVVSDRNLELNKTILSGDIGTAEDDSDNVFHVVVAAGSEASPIDASASLNGFSIIGAYANSGATLELNGKVIDHTNGGGVYYNSASPTMANIVISNNATFSRGGGLYLVSSSPMLTNVTISDNNAGTYGGGIYNEQSNPELTKVIIRDNTAKQNGGGMFNTSSSPRMTDVVISGNTATSYNGGGMLNSDFSNPTVVNAIISNNTAGTTGGGLYNSGGSPRLINVTISGNAATGEGGGIYSVSATSKPSLINTIVWDNRAGGSSTSISASIANGSGAVPTFAYSLIANSGGSGSEWPSEMGADGGGNLDGDPLFEDDENGNFDLTSGSPAINAGSNQAYEASESDMAGSDLAGEPRLKWRTIDLGAFEYQPAVLSVSEAPVDSLYKVGDELHFMVDFYAEVQVSGEPTLPFTIGEVSRSAVFSTLSEDGAKATFVYTIAENDRDDDGIVLGGALDVTGGDISFEDGGLGAVELTYNSPSQMAGVLVDGVKPVITEVSISSSNVMPSMAKVGDEVTLQFTVGEFTDSLTVVIAGKEVSATRGGKGDALKWTAVYQLTGEESEGVIAWSISDFHDEAGNVAMDVTETTDGSSVTFDKTSPEVTGVEDSMSYKENVTPEFNEGTATLNGAPFISETEVTDENEYILIVTDAAGNSDTVSFVIDKTVPVVTGVEDGASYNTDVTATFNEGTATLNGAPYISGEPIADEDNYTLVVADAAGNSDTVSFVVDKTVPVVTGVEDGASYNTDVTVAFNEGTATLNGSPYTSGEPITDEDNYTLVVTDAAGNADTVSFVVDKTVPVVTGVEDGASYNTDVTVAFNEGTATLNGSPYTPGEPIADEDNYTLVVTDAAGNADTVSFTIDKTVPEITGVEDGASYNEDVMVTFNEGEATLSGAPFNSGTEVTDEGDYTLIVTDAADNADTLHFTIDKTAPEITGVENGASYNEDVTVTFDEGTATLNGAPFTSGTAITGEDDYTLVVTDAAGNETTVHFTIDKTVPEITGVEDGASYDEDVTVTFNEGTALLNGAPYNPGETITGEDEYTLIVTDAAGNADTVGFTIDKTVPEITGVEEGASYNEDVTVTFNEGTATLNREPYNPGTEVTDEGDYTLIVTDAAGNADTVGFTIDKTVPEITGVEDGASYNEDVTVTFNEGTATLNGEPYNPGETITGEGEYTLIVTDAAGNEAVVRFVVDHTGASIGGVTDESIYSRDVTPTFDEGTATLNGAPFTSGTAITGEDDYTLVVTDAAGNETTVHFTIDKTAPVVTGVEDNGLYAGEAAASFNEGTALLNGEPYRPGTPVTVPGAYTLTVTDAGGNETTVTFTVGALPGAPTGLRAEAGNRQVMLEWEAPAGVIPAVTDYAIEYSVDGGTTWTVPDREPSAAARSLVIGLENNRTYVFRVSAVNGVGRGAASGAVRAIPAEPVPDGEGNLPEPEPGIPVVVTDGKVEAVMLEVVDSEYLRLSGDGYAMELASIGADGERIPISAIDAVIRLLKGNGTQVYVSGNGFEPGTVVTVYLFSTPELVGHLPVDGGGRFGGSLPVPADLELGEHTLQANGVVAGGGGERSVSIGLELVDRKPQWLEFGALADRTYGDGPVTLEATTTSDLPVIYTVTDAEGKPTDIAAIENNHELHIHGAGDILITATQVGNADYSAAAPVTRTLHIAKAPLKVSVADASRAYGEENPVFELTYEGFVNGEDAPALTVQPAAATDATATSAPGDYAITIAGGESSDYAFTYHGATLTITKAQQAIIFTAPGEVNRDAGSITLDVSSGSGLPVTLEADDAQVATVSGTTLHVHRLGTVRITATQAGDGNYEAAAPVTVIVRVTDLSSDFAVRVHPALSPNGDGVNEFLMVEGIKDYPENRVTIISRNGTVLWEASGYDNDRVVFRGISTAQQQLPAGTYFHIVEVKVNGKWEYEKGYFVIRY